jgi:hypothetical protein
LKRRNGLGLAKLGWNNVSSMSTYCNDIFLIDEFRAYRDREYASVLARQQSKERVVDPEVTAYRAQQAEKEYRKKHGPARMDRGDNFPGAIVLDRLNTGRVKEYHRELATACSEKGLGYDPSEGECTK